MRSFYTLVLHIKILRYSFIKDPTSIVAQAASKLLHVHGNTSLRQVDFLSCNGYTTPFR